MKKITKKIISLLMVCLTVFSAFPIAAGAVAENVTFTGPDGETYNHYPQILVTGFGSGCVKIYYEDDPEQKSLFWPFESERFIKNLANVDQYIVNSIKNKEPDVLYTVIYEYLMDCFGMLALNPDGSMMEGVTAEPVGLRYAGDGKYEFYYDCRQSPMLTANYLNDCIQQLLDETGSEKVELVGSSYGANVVTAFMYLYPEELHKVDTILQCVPSVGGIRFLGELLNGNFNISAKGLRDFMDRLSQTQIVPDFFYIMEQSGILELFLGALVVPVLREAVYDAIVAVARDFMATLPALWVCVPDEYFVAALEFLYGEEYDDPNQPYAKLISDMIFYHYNVANKAAEIYTDALENNDGLNMSFITKFGIAAIPFGTGENVMDDGLVTVPVSSFGATCTNYGEKLPANYEQQKYKEYDFMCPEWNIDASTGLLPFSTWYIRGLEHSQKNEDYLRLVDEIIYKDLDVFTDPNRPQYLTVSEDNPEMLIPLVAEEEKTTLYNVLFTVFSNIVLFPKRLLDKLIEIFSSLRRV